ncbi:MAG TPA: hypothetical protein VFT22_41485 [Kofleriaceae bacterium]|nr:hypothetical protein [Kofleriaceae bacterium]
MTEPAAAPPGAASLPDHPRIPRPRLSVMATVLGVFGVLVVAGYAWTAYAEYEPGMPQRDEIPASVRSSPGGYRSFHFWHSGYHGGK